MSWVIASDRRSTLEQPASYQYGQLITRGTLMIELDIAPRENRPRRLVRYRNDIGWTREFTVYLNPDATLSVEHVQGQTSAYARVDLRDFPAGPVRLSYSWDAPERVGMLSVECLENGTIVQAIFANPLPLPMGDGLALVGGLSAGGQDPSIQAMALGTHWARVGPGPTIGRGSFVATPGGARAIQILRPGDEVLTASGEAMKIRAVISDSRPSVGANAPVVVRAPFLGLSNNLTLASGQVVSPQVQAVEHLLLPDDATLPAGELRGRAIGHVAIDTPQIEYFQLLLDRPEFLVVNGMRLESLFIGQLARAQSVVDTTYFAELGAGALPVHHAPIARGLLPHDKIALLEVLAA